ncbi:Transcriptional regulator prz1 [Beauveria bassiana D1-5]|uniref:Transcriptional regulator prz1 n=1 Tax=Beauveria bassiana D1-5 TaxID=1245745 RepID=A0A0A2VPN0_BEABA|nr:Transcriptional regulator prz1 [Beauveria bassiana D1-5]
MTAVQKRHSRKQTVSLGLETIAFRTHSSTSSAISQHREQTTLKFHRTPGAILEPQTSDLGQERVPRAFLASRNEAMSFPLSGNQRLLTLQPNADSKNHSSHRQTLAPPTSITLAGLDRRPPSAVASLEARHCHGSTTSKDPSLQHLAADALQAVRPPRDTAISLPQLANDISISTRRLSLRDDHLPSLSTLSRDAPNFRSRLKSESQSPPPLLVPANGGLPPLQMVSPGLESLGQSLPSIRSTFGDINRIPPIEKETSRSPTQIPKCPTSPSGTIPRLPPISASHASPPISPNDVYRSSFPSPHSIASPEGSFGYPPRGSSYGTSRTGSDGDTAHSPSTSTQSHMSIDGITSGSIGSYICTFDGCNAHPFQTQYLLNSHANVHSSARPHYCPVKGCPRSEGGKGFKRKNEMIRHGLVHDSPGYVCPFCPDREHKYPRPDNLQRHVRVHHLEKDKDDPLLREVLSQRPDGPNRGRRRRAPAA